MQTYLLGEDIVFADIKYKVASEITGKVTMNFEDGTLIATLSENNDTLKANIESVTGEAETMINLFHKLMYEILKKIEEETNIKLEYGSVIVPLAE